MNTLTTLHIGAQVRLAEGSEAWSFARPASRDRVYIVSRIDVSRDPTGGTTNTNVWLDGRRHPLFPHELSPALAARAG